MAKKLISLLLVVVLTASVAVGATLAYLTDRDSKANVFTIGDVSIRLDEEFEQGSTLIPGVDIEKKPTITNTGSNDAWVWATIAFPKMLDNDDASKNVVHFNYTKESVAEGLWTWQDNGNWMIEEVEHEGVVYNVYTVLYQTALKPGETTKEPVMSKVYMDPHVDIDPEGKVYWVEGGNVTDLNWNVNTYGAPVVHVAAYGIQTEGFATVLDAYNAYKTQWGDTGAEWAEPATVVTTAEDLNDALAAGGPITLLEDVTAGAFDVAAGTDVELDLNDKAVTGIVENDGTIEITGGTLNSSNEGLDNRGNATLTDVDMNAGSSSDYAGISRQGSVTEYNNVNIVSAGGGVAAADGAKVVFNSGSVDVNTASTSGRYLFYAEGAGSEITINGGTFSFNKTQNQKRAYIYAGAGTTVRVNGGNFGPASTRSGYTAGIMGEGTVIITGGTFGFDPSNWVADGYQAVKTGDVWTVSAN